MYEFEYELTKSDYVDFNLYHAKNSKIVNKMLMVYRVVGPLLILLGGYYMTDGYKDLIGIIIYGISSLLWFIYCPRLHFKSIKRNITRMIDEGKDTSLFDLRQVVVNEREITEEIIDHKTFKSWKKIVKMGISKDNLFIYVSDVDALIIPKKIIGDEEESKAFIEYITNKFIK